MKTFSTKHYYKLMSPSCSLTNKNKNLQIKTISSRFNVRVNCKNPHTQVYSQFASLNLKLWIIRSKCELLLLLYIIWYLDGFVELWLKTKRSYLCPPIHFLTVFGKQAWAWQLSVKLCPYITVLVLIIQLTANTIKHIFEN